MSTDDLQAQTAELAEEDDGELTPERLREIAEALFVQAGANMPTVLRTIVDAVRPAEPFADIDAYRRWMTTCLRRLECFRPDPKDGDGPDDADFVTDLLFMHTDEFYAALLACVSQQERNGIPDQIRIPFENRKGESAAAVKVPRSRKAPPSPTHVDVFPAWFHDRARELLVVVALPVKPTAIGNLTADQRRALTELLGALLANGQGNHMKPLSGFRAEEARPFIAGEQTEAHPMLGALREAVLAAAKTHFAKGKRSPMDKSLLPLIAAYLRLDALAGGDSVHLLPKRFGVSSAAVSSWSKLFRDTPTDNLLAQAREVMGRLGSEPMVTE